MVIINISIIHLSLVLLTYHYILLYMPPVLTLKVHLTSAFGWNKIIIIIIIITVIIQEYK